MRRKAQVVDRQGRWLRDFVDGDVLADGEAVRVGMMCFDSKGEPVRTTDALANHKPCFRTVDAAQERQHGAYLARRHELAHAWRAAQ